MRICGGMWRGRAIKAPEGRDTRPTTDRLRESVASVVLSGRDLDLSDDAVLDAFAGSGALGLELLSRGARQCTFVECDRRAAAIVRANCEKLNGSDRRWRLLTGDVMRYAASGRLPGGPFSILMLDPPYGMPAEEVSDLVATLDARGMLTDDCMVIYERSAKGAGLEVSSFVRENTRKQGTAAVDVYLRGDDGE